MFDPVSLMTILTALIPTGNYAVRRIIDKFTGGAAPSNAAETTSQTLADTERLKALATLDTVGDTYQWVNAVRGLQRPIVVFGVLITWMLVTCGVVRVDIQIYVVTANVASSVMFYLFGDRTLMYSLLSFNKQLVGK